MPRIWGARLLAPLFPGKTHLAEPIGEVWLTGNDCPFAHGPFAGRTVREAWREMPPEWAGSRVRNAEPFPLLVKFLFPEEKLSIQVHPDDGYAQLHEAASGGRGKTEMWYVISARAGAEVMVGLKPDVTPESFRRAVANGTVEECLERIAVHAGDAIFVPAGTAHTIGAGMTLCEIQEHSDITYRVFDYNRPTSQGAPRPLHIKQALDAIHFGKQRGGKMEPVRITRGSLTETYLVACRYFAAEKWEFSERIAAATQPEHFELLIVLAGNGQIEFGESTVDYAPAQVWLLPAALGAYGIAPGDSTTLLRTYVPDMNEFVRRLSDQRVEEAVWSRLVHPR